MKFIEKHISPLIESQFPTFHREEGQKFISFIKAYYEWLENSLIQVTVLSTKDFSVNDIVSQGESRGKIISIMDDYNMIVQMEDMNVFYSDNDSDEIVSLISENDAETNIVFVERFNAIHWARNLPEIRDIDKTIDEFILSFKNKYLSNVQFTTATNKQLFIKNALDFYRAKGTPRAIDLYFKLVYGFGADVYFPSQDTFTLSGNEWDAQTYLEIKGHANDHLFIGNTIHGTISNSTAFVSSLIRLNKFNQPITVLFISNLQGDFQTNENVETRSLETNISARIIGSLSSFKINRSDANFKVGEEVKVLSEFDIGRYGRGQVRATEEATGVVRFSLRNGGWGYTKDSTIVGSEYVLSAEDVIFEDDNYPNNSRIITQFENITQYLIEVNLQNTDIFPRIGYTVRFYDSVENEIQDLNGKIVAFTDNIIAVNCSKEINSNDISNIASVEVDTLDEEDNIIPLTSEVTTPVIDISSTGEVIDTSNEITITYTPVEQVSSSLLQRGDQLYQTCVINGIERIYAYATVKRTDNNFTTNTFSATIEFTENNFRTNLTIFRVSDEREYNILKITSFRFGIIPPSGQGIFSSGNSSFESSFFREGEFVSHNINTKGRLNGVFSYSEKASFEIVEFSDRQTIPGYYTDIQINSLLTEDIGSNDYGSGRDGITNNRGFPDPIEELFVFNDIEIGSAAEIVTTDTGRGYPVDPFFIIKDARAKHFQRYDFLLTYTDLGANFISGERIGIFNPNDNSVDYVGKIHLHLRNDRKLFVTRQSIGNEANSQALNTINDFKPGNIVVGETSNVSVLLEHAKELRTERRTGYNADILSEAFDGEGFATSVDVISSGFGYIDDRVLTLESEETPGKTIEVTGFLGRQGISSGFYRNTKSFLSTNKYLHDNDYYQNYSYEVQTSLPFEIYKNTLIDVLHVAGTRPFGKYVQTNETKMTISSVSNTTIIDES